MILLTRWECFFFFSQISQWAAASWGSFRELYGEESTFAKVTNHSTWEAGVLHTPADVGTWSNCGIYIHRYCWCLKLSAVGQTCCWNFRICWIHSYIEWGVLYYLVCRRSEFHSQTPRGGVLGTGLLFKLQINYERREGIYMYRTSFSWYIDFITSSCWPANI